MDPEEIKRKEAERLERKRRKQEERLRKLEEKRKLMQDTKKDQKPGEGEKDISMSEFDDKNDMSDCDEPQSEDSINHNSDSNSNSDNESSFENDSDIGRKCPFSIDSLLETPKVARGRRPNSKYPRVQASKSVNALGIGMMPLYPITQPVGFIVEQRGPHRDGHDEDSNDSDYSDICISDTNDDEHLNVDNDDSDDECPTSPNCSQFLKPS